MFRQNTSGCTSKTSVFRMKSFFFQKHNWTFKYIINFGKSLDVGLAIWLLEVAPEEIIYNVSGCEIYWTNFPWLTLFILRHHPCSSFFFSECKTEALAYLKKFNTVMLFRMLQDYNGARIFKNVQIWKCKLTCRTDLAARSVPRRPVTGDPTALLGRDVAFWDWRRGQRRPV